MYILKFEIMTTIKLDFYKYKNQLLDTLTEHKDETFTSKCGSYTITFMLKNIDKDEFKDFLRNLYLTNKLYECKNTSFSQVSFIVNESIRDMDLD